MVTRSAEGLSPRVKARLAGVFWLLTILTGAFALFMGGRSGPAVNLVSTACYLAATVLIYLARSLSPYIMIPGILGEVSLTLWLLVAGVEVPRWNDQARVAFPPTT